MAVAEHARLARRLAAAGRAALEADDVGAGVAQSDRGRQSDDAGTDDRDVSTHVPKPGSRLSGRRHQVRSW
jgi:hypothetical protein